MSHRNDDPSIRDMEQIAACTDCDSIVTIIEVAPGFYTARVAHDDTCPWFAALKSEGTQ